MAFYRCIGGGSGVSPTDITPSNSSPVALTANDPVNPLAAGYAIESYESVTPSNADPVTLINGRIVKLGGSGIAVQSILDAIPYNSMPQPMTMGYIYKVKNRNGYLIYTYAVATPSDTSPTKVYSSNFVQVQSYDGYLYRTRQEVNKYSLAAKDTASAATSKTISNQSGKYLLLLVFNASSSSIAYNRYDGISVSGGTAAKITTLEDSNHNVAGTFYTLKVTSDTCTITSANNCRIIAFGSSHDEES